MLSLAALSPTAPELGSPGFADHLDDRVLYAAPAELALVPGPGDDPGLLLVLYQSDAVIPGGGSAGVSGGWLRARLAPSGPSPAEIDAATSAGWTLPPFPVERVDYRLTRVLAAGTEERLTGWVEGDASDGGATLALDLTEHQAAVIAACLVAGDEVLSVRARLRFRAMLPGLPAVAAVDPTALLAWLRPVLGQQQVTADGVGAALLSLPDGGPVRFTAHSRGIDPGELPDRASLLAALVAPLLDVLTAPAGPEPTARVLRAEPDLPSAAASHLVVDLAVPRLESRWLELDWSVSAAVRGADPAARDRMVVGVSPPQPFAAVAVHVVSTLPAGVVGLTGIKVEVQTPGPTGAPVPRVFDVDGPGIQRFTTFYPALTTQWHLRYRLSALLGDADRARVWLTPRRAAATPVVRVDAAALGLTLARLSADLDVFARCDRLDVLLTSTTAPEAARTVQLTAERAQVSVALPPADWLVGVVAHGRLGAVATLAPAHPLPSNGVVAVHAGDLVPQQADAVRVELAPPTGVSLVFALLTVAAPGMLERSVQLQPGVATPIPVLRAGALDPVRFSWQLRFVVAGPDGRTRPMETTPWHDAVGSSLLLSLPVPPDSPASSVPAKPADPADRADPAVASGPTR